VSLLFVPFCFGFDFVYLFISHKEFYHLIKEIKFFSLFSDRVKQLFVSLGVFLMNIFQLVIGVFQFSSQFLDDFPTVGQLFLHVVVLRIFFQEQLFLLLFYFQD